MCLPICVLFVCITIVYCWPVVSDIIILTEPCMLIHAIHAHFTFLLSYLIIVMWIVKLNK